MKPLVTIITPSFNQGNFIEATIQSIINQTYTHIEYIIVDGCSTDNTMQIVTKYKDKITTIISEKDKGQSDAINKGFRIAKGELVGWLNSDDILYKDCVERIVELFNENPKAFIYYHSKSDFIDIKGNIIKSYQKIIPNHQYLLRVNYDVIQPGSFYNTDAVRKVGYLDESCYYCMDLDLWLKLSKSGSICYSDDKSYAGFRLYPGTKTDTGGKAFLDNINRVLKRNGVKFYNKTVLKILFDLYFKSKIKKLIGRR